MKIRFQGLHNTNEAIESLASMLKMFQEQYGIENFDNIELDVVLLDQDKEAVEIVDAASSEIYEEFEVVRAGAEEQRKKPRLRLAVDNTVH